MVWIDIERGYQIIWPYWTRESLIYTYYFVHPQVKWNLFDLIEVSNGYFYFI